MTRLDIRSTVGGTLRLLSPWDTIAVRRGGGAPKTLEPNATGIVTLETRPSDILRFTKR